MYPKKVYVNTWVIEGKVGDSVKKLKELGFSGVELPGPEFIPEKERASLADLLKKEEMEPVSVCAGLGLHPEKKNMNSGNTKIREEAILYMCKCVDLAKELDAKMVIVATGRIEKGTPLDEQWLSAVNGLKTVCRYAESKNPGLQIVLESFPGRLIGYPEMLSKMIGEVKCNNLGGCLDTGHEVIMRNPFAESVKKFGDNLYHVHIDSNDGVNDIHWRPGSGAIEDYQFKELFKALKETGYKGLVSFEVKPGDNGLETAKLTMQWYKRLKSPKSGFGGFGPMKTG